MGVDNIELAAYQTPPLTTVRQSLTDVATLGPRSCWTCCKAMTPSETQVVFEPELDRAPVDGQTTGHIAQRRRRCRAARIDESRERELRRSRRSGHCAAGDLGGVEHANRYPLSHRRRSGLSCLQCHARS